MCSWDSDGQAIPTQVSNRQSVIGNEFRDSAVVDGAECVELVDARRELAVLDVRHPRVGNMIFPAAPVLRNLLALLFHVACGQSKALAQCLQALSGTRTWLACVHWRESYAGKSSLSSYVTLL